MHQDGALTLGGEFRDRERESAFQAARLGETARQGRLLFILSAILNTLFLASDWRFQGDPHFDVAVPARLAVVAGSILGAALLWRADSQRRTQAILLAWQAITACGVALLVSSRSDLALFVVLLLPSIFYLVVPTSFRWRLFGGIGCSALMLGGYLGVGPPPSTFLGLVIVLLTLNVALVLVVSHGNRLRRMEWAATQAERRAKDELVASRAMVERLFMTVPIPLVVVEEASGALLRANEAARRFLGCDEASLATTRIAESFIEEDERRELVRRLHRDGRLEGFEMKALHGNGSLRDVVLTASALNYGGAPSVVAGILDITERKAAEAKARRQATHDTLTGLPNRALFQEQLAKVLLELGQAEAMIGLFLVDLDDFKSVNDTLGHDAGDALLFQAASRLAGAIGPEDFVARLGGDEFVVLSNTPLTRAQVEAKADDLLEALRSHFTYGGHTLSARASIGIALAPEHDRDPVELMKDADLALYRAKALGRNTAVIYEPAMRAALTERVAICRDVAEALRAGKIVPFYQPQVSLQSGRIVGFEALARWNHANRGIVSAGTFPQAFEDADIAAGIGEAIMRQVMRDVRSWLDSGIEVGRVSVNLAPGAFRNPALARAIIGQLEEAGVPAARFAVEVTETVLLTRDANGVEAALADLRAAGIHVALDDFGTGFASLTHLRRFPVDVIKIDRSFIQQVDSHAGDGAIVRAVLDLARDLAIDVVAEGVETAAQEAFLRRHACAVAQGFRYAKPVAASRVPWLAARPSLIPPPEAEMALAKGAAA